MKPEETVDYNIKVAWHAISRMYNTQAAQNDITTSIGFVLLNIDQDKGTPATKIAPLLGLEIHPMSFMVSLGMAAFFWAAAILLYGRFSRRLVFWV